VLTLSDITCVRGHGTDAFSVSVENLTIKRAETVAITGKSGSGKSTLLEILALVLRPQVRGCFKWESRRAGGSTLDLAQLWHKDARRELTRIRAGQIGFVLQTGGLLPYLDVQSNIELSRHIECLPRKDSPVPRLIKALELTRLCRKLPHELSVGERQRVSIARAMAHEPELLLADEPTASLDPELEDQVIALMLTAVIVTHDRERFCPHVDREVIASATNDGMVRGTRFAVAT